MIEENAISVPATAASSAVCPHCATNNLEDFMFCENHTLTARREVGEFVDGVLQVEADYELSPMGDAGTGTPVWLECGGCGEEFPIPAEVTIEFVDELWK